MAQDWRWPLWTSLNLPEVSLRTFWTLVAVHLRNASKLHSVFCSPMKTKRKFSSTSSVGLFGATWLREVWSKPQRIWESKFRSLFDWKELTLKKGRELSASLD